MSWTWVIGMYLPILMVRDLGLAGYLVFAVPNVIGAAAMGWVLRSPESSRRLTEAHADACRAFSIVTLGYHLFWLCWLGGWAWTRWSVGPMGLLVALVLAVGVGLGWRLFQFAGLARLAALLVLAVSLGAMLVYLLAPEGAEPAVADRLADVPFTTDAIWMLPVSTLGFALCPYLDLTFNRARQACETPGQSRFAFGVGFGVFFALMIVFTLLYAGPMVGFVDGSNGAGVVIPTLIAAALAVHVGLQWMFTVSVHTREISAQPRPWAVVSGLAFVACTVAGLAGAMLAEQRWFGMAPGEVGYRVLLSFYGLVFPAYVWINVIDLRARRMRTATRRSLAVTAAAIALAAPFYFVGFIMRDEPWLAPGFLIVILAKLAAGRADRARPLPSA
jgi:hypothetical protein